MGAFDVAVIGGGPAGLATALAARERGLTVILVERSDFEGVRVGEHIGAEALPVLASLGVPPATWHDGHLPCSSVRSIWGDDTEREAHSLFNPFGEGRILSRPRFDRDLASFAERRGVVVRARTEVVSVRRGSGGAQLTLAGSGGKERCRASFLVDAGGRSAGVARGLGAQPIVYDRLVGVTAFLDSPAGERDRSVRVEACEGGWWYSAPLADGRRVLTFMTDADLITGPPSAVFHRALAESAGIAALCRGREAPSRVIVRSARSQRLTTAGGDGWLAVGDAAMAFDPLSSEGIRKGLTWGRRAAEVIGAYLDGDTSAPFAHAEEIHEAFEGYLAQRAHYYRLEGRWPASLFWARRHGALASETPITLDPAEVIRAPADGWGSPLARIAAQMPQIDRDHLRAITAEPKMARDIVTCYRERVGSGVMDRDVIIALQIMARE